MIIKVFCLTLFLVACFCQNFAFSRSDIDIDWLYKANPVSDFKKAIKRGDYRFMGVYGYSINVPGVRLKCIDISKDIKPIEGTSDSYSSYEEEKFNAVARVYADHYNFQMRKYLEGKKLFSCKNQRDRSD